MYTHTVSRKNNVFDTVRERLSPLPRALPFMRTYKNDTEFQSICHFSTHQYICNSKNKYVGVAI